MKKFFAAATLVGLLAPAIPTGTSVSRVAKCATGMGVPEVAACAEAMDKGVSAYAKGLDTYSLP
jgi:hypothetical protein